MVKTKAALVSALDEQKAVAESEAKERVSLLGKFRNMEHAADGLRESYEEEVSSKENLARQLNKALGDADLWRQKYEVDGLAKAEELEMTNLKLQVGHDTSTHLSHLASTSAPVTTPMSLVTCHLFVCRQGFLRALLPWIS